MKLFILRQAHPHLLSLHISRSFCFNKWHVYLDRIGNATCSMEMGVWKPCVFPSSQLYYIIFKQVWLGTWSLFISMWWTFECLFIERKNILGTMNSPLWIVLRKWWGPLDGQLISIKHYPLWNASSKYKWYKHCLSAVFSVKESITFPCILNWYEKGIKCSCGQWYVTGSTLPSHFIIAGASLCNHFTRIHTLSSILF